MSAPEDFDARAAFRHVTTALDAQATHLKSLDAKQDRQAERLASIDGHLVSMDGRLAAAEGHLDSIDSRLASVDGHLASLDRKVDQVVTQLHTLNASILRGFTNGARRDAALAKRLDKLEADVAVLKRRNRAPRKR
jgi:septal ring factor EnvC (AmiA/AmiB activator)